MGTVTSDNLSQTAFVKDSCVTEAVCESFFTPDKKATPAFVTDCKSVTVQTCEKL